MNLNNASPSNQQIPSQDEQHQINELTITPAEVWQGHGDGTGSGDFTPKGRRLRKQNAELAEHLARLSQHDHSKAFPSLYPQVTGGRPADRPELRRKPAPASAPKRISSLPDDQLAIHFGSMSDGGKAQALYKANPALYKASRDRAIELKLLPATRSRIGREGR